VSFQTPWALLLLLLIPVGIALYAVWQRRGSRSAVPFPDLDVVALAAPRPRLRRHLPVALLALALAGGGFALARPEITTTVPRDRATIMLAIDISRSMTADDVVPYRLRAAQDAALRFADKVPRHFEVGLVSFSGGASVLLQPSTDRIALKRSIESLVPEGATAIGDAVLASLDAVRATQPGVTTLQSARILLLSDGKNTNGASVGEAADAAKAAGVPVFTVALGTSDGVIFGNGGTIPVPPDPEALGALAEITGGVFFESKDADSVKKVYDNLGTFIGTRNVQQEVTAWPAGIAALLLLFAGAAAWRFGPRLS
jgi:Ca-activated chloride channel family protein